MSHSFVYDDRGVTAKGTRVTAAVTLALEQQKSGRASRLRLRRGRLGKRPHGGARAFLTQLRPP